MAGLQNVRFGSVIPVNVSTLHSHGLLGYNQHDTFSSKSASVTCEEAYDVLEYVLRGESIPGYKFSEDQRRDMQAGLARLDSDYRPGGPVSIEYYDSFSDRQQPHTGTLLITGEDVLTYGNLVEDTNVGGIYETKDEKRERLKAEKRLDTWVKQRVAGAPQQSVTLHGLSSVIDKDNERFLLTDITGAKRDSAK